MISYSNFDLPCQFLQIENQNLIFQAWKFTSKPNFNSQNQLSSNENRNLDLKDMFEAEDIVIRPFFLIYKLKFEFSNFKAEGTVINMESANFHE